MAETVTFTGRVVDLPPSSGDEHGIVYKLSGRPVTQGSRTALRFTAATVNSSGSHMVLADQRGNVDVLDLRTGRACRVDASGMSVDHAMLAGADTVVCAMTDTTLRCLVLETREDTGVTTGSVAGRLTGHADAILTLAGNADGPLLLSASAATACLWNRSTWTRARTLGHESGIAGAGMSSRADVLALAFRDDQVMAWSTTNFGVLARLRLPEAEAGARLQCVSLSHDASMLAAGAANGCVYLWDVPTQALTRVVDFPAQGVAVTQVAIMAPSALAQLPGMTDVPRDALPRVFMLGENGRFLIVELSTGVCSAVWDTAAVAELGGGVDSFSVAENGIVLALRMRDGRVLIVDTHAAERQRAQADADAEAAVAQEDEEDGEPAASETTHGDAAPPPMHSMSTMAPPSVSLSASLEDVPAPRPAPVRRSVAPPPVATFMPEGVIAGQSDPARATSHGSARMRAAAAGAVPQHARRPAASQDSSKSLYESMARVLTVPRTGVGSDAANSVALSEATRATHSKLRGLLDLHEAFPADYRTLAWRFLLRLPGSTSAYADISNRGAHAAWADMEERYPVRDRRLLTRLAKVVNALSHWSPVYGELPFLPALAFPFVKFFGSDDLSAFECVMTVLINWGRHWIETLPHPPVPLLARVHVLLQHWDAPLAAHLQAAGVDPSRYAWPILRSGFSEVLPRKEWEMLWDRLITDAHDPSLMVYAVVAFLRVIRAHILGVALTPAGPQPHPGTPYGSGTGGLTGPFAGGPIVSAGAPLLSTGVPGFSGTQAAVPFIVTPAVQEICALVRYQTPLHMRSMLRMMRDMRARTPTWVHPFPVSDAERITPTGAVTAAPGSALRADGPVATVPVPRAGVGETGWPVSSQADTGTTARVEGMPDTGPLHALPQDHYPPFLRYPRAVIDFAVAERERIAAEEEALRRKKAISSLLTQRTAELAAEEEAWRLERTLLEHAEARRAAEAEAATAIRDREAAILDEEITNARLAGLATMQEAARQALAAQRARRATIASRAAADRTRLAHARDAIVRRRMADEALMNLELQAVERVRGVNEERDDEEARELGRASADQRKYAASLADELTSENWRIEDEERRVKRMAEMTHAEKVARATTLQRQQAADEAQHLLGQLERDAALMGIARERRVRHAAEDAAASAHGMAAAMLRTQEAEIGAALQESKEAASTFAGNLRNTDAEQATRFRELSEAARAEADVKIRAAAQRQAEAVRNGVGTRMAKLAAAERASAGAEAAAEERVARMFAQALPRAPVPVRGGRAGEKVSLGSGARAMQPDVMAQERAAAEVRAHDAVDMARELVAREAAIVHLERQRAGLLGAEAAPSPAAAVEQARQPHVPDRQPVDAGTTEAIPDYDDQPPSPPALARGRPASRTQGAVHARAPASSLGQAGLAFGAVDGGASVVPTPSLGSRSRGLRSGNSSSAATRVAEVKATLAPGADLMPTSTATSLSATRYSTAAAGGRSQALRSTSRGRSTSAGSIGSESTASALSQGPLDVPGGARGAMRSHLLPPHDDMPIEVFNQRIEDAVRRTAQGRAAAAAAAMGDVRPASPIS